MSVLRNYCLSLSCLCFAIFSPSLAFANDGPLYYWTDNTYYESDSSSVAAAVCSNYPSTIWTCYSFSLDNAGASSHRYEYFLERETSSGTVYSTAKSSVFRRLCSTLPVGVSVPASCDIPEECSDGFPPNLLGYYGCDRPKIKQCDDGSYVRMHTHCPLVPKVCSDYASCLAYSQTEASCPSTALFEFSYTDPLNFSYSCNEQLDPLPPVDNEKPVTDLDFGELLQGFDESFSTFSSNIERAVRDGSDKVSDSVLEGTGNTTDAVNNWGQTLDFTVGSVGEDIVSAINGLSLGGGEGGAGYDDSGLISFLSSAFGTVNSLVSGIGSTLSDIYDFITAPFDEDEPDLSELAVTEFTPDFDEVTYDFGAAVCPAPIPISIPFLDLVIEISFNFLCDFLEMIKPLILISAYLFSAYIYVGVVRR